MDQGAGVGVFQHPQRAIRSLRHVADALTDIPPLCGLRATMAVNGPDGDVPTSGPTGIVVFSDIAGGAPPIAGTVISQNIISNEDIGIAVATNGAVDAHLNSLDKIDVGVANLSGGTVDARQNWWGCKDGPTDSKCSQIVGPNVLFDPWLTKKIHDDKEGAKQ